MRHAQPHAPRTRFEDNVNRLVHEATRMLGGRQDLGVLFGDAVCIHLPKLLDNGLLPRDHYDDILARMLAEYPHATPADYQRALAFLQRLAPVYSINEGVAVLRPDAPWSWVVAVIHRARSLVASTPSDCAAVCLDPLCPRKHYYDRRLNHTAVPPIIRAVILDPLVKQGVLSASLCRQLWRRVSDAITVDGDKAAHEAFNRAAGFIMDNAALMPLHLEALAEADTETLRDARGYNNRCALLNLTRVLGRSARTCAANKCPYAFCANRHGAHEDEAEAFRDLLHLLLSDAAARGVIQSAAAAALVQRLVDSTPPSSRRSRVCETAALVYFAVTPSFAALGRLGLAEGGTYGLAAADDLLAFDVDGIEHDPQTREAIIQAVELGKVGKRIRGGGGAGGGDGAADVSFKHFEVSSDKHMGIGPATKEALLQLWRSRDILGEQGGHKKGANGERAADDKPSPPRPAKDGSTAVLTLYHLIALFRTVPADELLQTLKSSHPAHGWTAEKLTETVVIRTLKYLHLNSALQPLLPPNKFDYERECFAAIRRLAHALQPMVRTRQAEAEGGARSCFKALADWARAAGKSEAAMLLRYLVVTSNMLAHQGVVHLPLFLTVVAVAIARLAALDELPLLHSRGAAGALPADQAAESRRHLERLAVHVRDVIEWDYSPTHPLVAALRGPRAVAAPDVDELAASLGALSTNGP